MQPSVIIYGCGENYTTYVLLQKHLVWLRVIKQSWIICPQMYKKNTSSKRDICIVRLTSINVQKTILKNPVFKSTFIFLDVY